MSYHHDLDVSPIPEKVLYINESDIADLSLIESPKTGSDRVQDDNVRIYVPLDLNQSAILRRLESLGHRLGRPMEFNDSNYSLEMRRIISQLEIYDQVWYVREGDYPSTPDADYYRAGALKKKESADDLSAGGPPWRMDVPDLATYAWRGARQLDTRCYKGKCFQCKWAAMANVAIEYNWDTGLQKHRFESFCYGPKICKFYKMGKARAVSCKGMGTFYDEGYLDELCTERRGYDE